jgi:hypothetical protein
MSTYKDIIELQKEKTRRQMKDAGSAQIEFFIPSDKYELLNKCALPKSYTANKLAKEIVENWIAENLVDERPT